MGGVGWLHQRDSPFLRVGSLHWTKKIIWSPWEASFSPVRCNSFANFLQSQSCWDETWANTLGSGCFRWILLNFVVFILVIYKWIDYGISAFPYPFPFRKTFRLGFLGTYLSFRKHVLPWGSEFPVFFLQGGPPDPVINGVTWGPSL